MSNAVVPFAFKDRQVRVVQIDGQPWFVAADVCRVLELKPHKDGSFTRHLRRLQDDERRLVTRPTILSGGLGQGGMTTLISESGVYKLILRSDKPEAREFQDWVTRVVLPAIRKDGAYVAGEERYRAGEMSADELLSRAVLVAQKKLEHLEAERA